VHYEIETGARPIELAYQASTANRWPAATRPASAARAAASCGLRRVNYGVNLQRGGHVDGAAVVVLFGQQLREQGLALRPFRQRFESLR